MVAPIPEEWVSGLSRASGSSASTRGITCLPCESYREVATAWRKALKWRQDLDDVLVTMLAVAVSTEQIGDQLFLQVIGEAGGGKTRLCEAMLVNDGCYALEHLTGFHSGWQDGSGDDFSLISRIDRKTLITPEGDVLMSSPRFVEIMSQQRRIFDGTSGASYKNMKKDMHYTGLRTPWIIAGTPALMETDQSRLGDRFLRVIINEPTEEEKQAILLRVGYTALRSVVQTSDGKPETQLEERMYEAYRLTGGYVGWLRDNAADLLSSLVKNEKRLISCCANLGEFTAYMRARPNPDTKAETHAAKESPTRLMHQYVRLACCVAVVLNLDNITDEVMRRVHKVAMDTSRGMTLAMTRHLHQAIEEGLQVCTLAAYTSRTEEKTRRMLRFLKRIGVARVSSVKGTKGRPRWRLTDRMQTLYKEVME